MISSKFLSVFVVVQYFVHLTYCQSSAKFFRKDYVYIEETQAFYKFQTRQKSWADAKNKCQMEGAMLFYPGDEDEAAAVISYWNSTQPYISQIYIGVATPSYIDAFQTIDGFLIADVYDKWGPREPNNADGYEDCVAMGLNGTLNDVFCTSRLPFLCKKALGTLEWHNLCNIPDPAYEYNENKGRCYKFHLDPKNWIDAFEVCNSEHSYLAIINDEEEAAILADLTNRAPKDTVDGDFLRGAVYLGFYKNNQWKTIKGATLRNSGYSTWGGGQPDGRDNELCGSMFYNGQLNDMSCSQKLFFICEHEIDILSMGIIFRYGDIPSTGKS